MRIFLDDERFPPDDGREWIIARSFDDVLELTANGLIDYISFDHDLGDNVPTGMDVCKWLVEQDMNYAVLDPNFTFYVHSQNPLGAENIRSYLDQYLRAREMREW